MKVKELIKVLQAFDKGDYDVEYTEFDENGEFDDFIEITVVAINTQLKKIVLTNEMF